jgi:hypothetical protein
MSETTVQLGAAFNYEELKGGLQAGSEAFKEAMNSLENSFTEVSASAERSFSKISEDVKVAASTVSAEMKEAAGATAELILANKDLAAAQRLVQQTAGEDANALALLAAAQQRQKAAALEVAAATKEEAEAFEISSAEIRESMLKTLESAELTGAGIKSAFGGLGALLGLGIAGQLAAEWLTATGEMVDHLQHLHGATDISLGDLQALQIASQQLGMSFDLVQTSIFRLSKNAMAALHNETGQQAQAFHKLGIETSELKDLINDLPELMQRVGEGLEHHTTAGTKAGIATMLLGRNSGLLAGSLGELALAAKQAKTELETMGGVIDEKDVAAAHDLDVTTARMSASWRSLMLPIFDAAVTALKSIESVLIAAKGEIQGYEQAWIVSAVGLKDSVIPVLKAIALAMTGRWSEAGDAIKEVWQRVKSTNALALQAMEKENADAAKKIGAIWADVQPGVKTKIDEIGDLGKKKTNAETAEEWIKRMREREKAETDAILDKMEEDQFNKTQRRLHFELKMEEEKNNEILRGLKTKQEIVAALDESDKQHAAAQRQITVNEAEFERSQGLISAQQLLKIKRKALDEEYRDEQIALLNELSLYEQGTVEYAKTLAKIRKMDDKYRLDSQKADQQAAAQKVRIYDVAFGRINSAFQNAFRSMTQSNGSFLQSLGQSWNDAMAQIGASLEKLVLDFIESRIKMLVFHQATKTAEVETDAAAEKEKEAIGLEGTLKDIFQSAKKGAARAYAAVSDIPIIGPALAPEAAAVAFAGIMAFGSMASAAGGWDRVPEDQIAQIHKDEMVLPASLAGGLRTAISNMSFANPAYAAAGSGGGASITFNQSATAMDSRGVDRVFRNNRKTIQKQVVRALRMRPARR